MESDRIERIEQIEINFKRRYRIKKLVNLLISILIAVSGILSVLFIWNYDREGLLTFRWMTVDGTIFTTAASVFYVVVSILEIARYTELTSLSVYFARLASAVAEGLIVIVVLLSQLPISPEHLHIFRFDMFQMHILIPVLTIMSFILNDSPIGKLSFRQKLQGTWFITLYAAVILTLILTGIIPAEQIPYFFLDVAHMPALAFIGCFVFIYSVAILLSHFLSNWNRKLSWLWFRGVAGSSTGSLRTRQKT